MNLILACDTAKVLNHEFVEPSVGNQFYIRAKHDVYFVGLRAMINKYFANPITQEDIDEAREVMLARGQLKEFKIERWERVLKEYGGYLPISIRALPEGSFVKAGEPLMVIESSSIRYSWVPYVIDSIVLRSIWYPSSLATRLMAIKKELYWCEDPRLVYDISNRAAQCEESGEIAASVVKMVFGNYDSIQADLFLYRNYGYQIQPVINTYLTEHNHIIGWHSEQAFYQKLSRLEKNSVAVCLVDTNDVDRCVELLISDEIQRLAIENSLSLYLVPDSVDTTRELKAIQDKISHVNMGIVKTGLDMCGARKMGQLGFNEGRVAFQIEDCVLQHSLSRNTYGFEYKQCSVKRGMLSEWEPVSKKPSHKPEMHTLSGYQIFDNNQTVFISGHIINCDDFYTIYNRLAVGDVER